ncbi:unnamed protein product [Notodromas monacha]|uniref:Conserved oligomeric Golgi complex subunit 6 n=1 Tax=Notodromas monacha TaxID=399045 RepID=A0A7R9G8B2_9CRUS|nr:unnamed protein product [Notodromas monacha]CAG0912970.1 unnamed protein product [Notodromas monacha]
MADVTSIGGSSRENPLSRKLTKILDTRLETDKDLLDSLNELSNFFTENNLRTRRNLRGDIEKRSLDINKEFLESFRDIKDSLELLYSETKMMNQTCVQMRDRLITSKTSVQDLISATNELKVERERIDVHKALSDGFCRTFFLTAEEKKLLSNARDSGGISSEFFDALDRAKDVHRNSQVLLQTGQQKAALEIRENMALFQESGLEKLYRWAQQQCRMRVGLNSPTEMSPLLVKGMAYLQDRPALFRYIIEEYCTYQRNEMVRGFIDAMTREDEGRKPIEMQAHDPPRYVGDMLAWVHQTVPSEIEALDQLLSKCKEGVGGASETLKELKLKSMGQITEGLCRPLRTRVEQVVLSEPGAVQLSMLDSTVTFYVGTLRQVLPEKGALMAALSDLALLTHKTFLSALSTQAVTLAEKLKTGVVDETENIVGYLAPLPIVHTVAALLKDVLQAQSMLEIEQREVPLILNAVLDPFLTVLQESVVGMTTAESAAYMINCLYLLHSTLSLYNFTNEKVGKLKSMMDANVDALTNEQASFLVQRLGLGQIYVVLQQRASGVSHGNVPLSQLPGMDPLAIQTFNTCKIILHRSNLFLFCLQAKFNAYLAHVDSLTLTQVSAVLSATARNAIRQKCSQVLLLIYKQLHKEVNDPANGYDPTKMLTSSPEQIETLIQRMEFDCALLDARLESCNFLLNKIAGQQWTSVGGIVKLRGVLSAERKYLEKVKRDPNAICNPVQALTSSNLDHFGGLVDSVEALLAVGRRCQSVMKKFRREEPNSCLDVDVVADEGSTWIKVVARNPMGTFSVFRDASETGYRTIVGVGELWLEMASRNPLRFRPPQVVFHFIKGVNKKVADALDSIGVRVSGIIFPSTGDFDVDPAKLRHVDNLPPEPEKVEFNRLNLDVTTLIAYVSALSNNEIGCDAQGRRIRFENPTLKQQLQWEMESRVKNRLDEIFEGKQLLCCKTAYMDFKSIVTTVGGPNEKRWAEELETKLIVVPDIVESNLSSKVRTFSSGKIRSRSLVIFGTGDEMKIPTVTGNVAFLRSVHDLHLNLVTITHQTRALSEMKEIQVDEKAGSFGNV